MPNPVDSATMRLAAALAAEDPLYVDASVVVIVVTADNQFHMTTNDPANIDAMLQLASWSKRLDGYGTPVPDSEKIL